MHGNYIPKKHRSLNFGECLPYDSGSHLLRRTCPRGALQAIRNTEACAVSTETCIVCHSQPGPTASIVTQFESDPQVGYASLRSRLQHMG